MNLSEATGSTRGMQIAAFFWFGAVFLTIFCSKLWLIDLFGSALPWWDQWAAEGWFLYIPCFNKTLALKDLFTAHCEHRIFVNRVIALFLLILNGQWDARLGMILNAGLTAFTGVVLSAFGWTLLGRRHLALISIFNTLVFSLPFSWECSLLGFVGNYWLIFFALLAIWFLTRHEFFGIHWLLGILFALISLVTMGSGFFAAVAAAAVILLRLILRRGRIVPDIRRQGPPSRINNWQTAGTGQTSLQNGVMSKRNDLITMAVLLVIIAAGYYLRVNVPGHEVFKPANARELIVSFCQNLAWPNHHLAWTALIVWFPSLILFGTYIIRRDDTLKAAEFVLCFGFWVVLQAAALAFTRYGAIASRHTVFLCLSLPVNFLAILFLFKSSLPSVLRNIAVIVFLIWTSDVGYHLWKISDKANLVEAAKYKAHLVQSEKNVRAFIQTDDIADLENRPLHDIPFPDPQALAVVLHNPHIRAILPSCVNEKNKPGPLSVAAAKLIPKGDKIIFLGIGLLIILSGMRFYQSLGALEKRLTNLRWNNFKQLLMYAGFTVVTAVFLAAIHGLYSILSLDGLAVTYFRGKNFEEKICGRTEKAVVRDYEDRSPAWRVPSKNFSAIWQGILRVPETAGYSFFSQSDDGLRLIIDGKKIIDNWQDQSWDASATGVQVHLAAGDHTIAVEHYNSEGESALRVKWSGGPIPPNTVLAAPYLRKHK